MGSAATAGRVSLQEDRGAAGEVFGRVQDALVLERAVRARVEREKAPIQGSCGRPSDEYPREACIAVALVRVAPAPVRIEDELAVIEAA